MEWWIGITSFAVPIVFFLVTLFAFALLLLYLYRKRHEEIETRKEIFNRLLDRYAQAREFIEFLRTPEGREFIELFAPQRKTLQDRLIAYIRNGVIFTLLGLGMIAFAYLEGDPDISFLVVIFLAIGIGYLFTAWTTYRMYRRSAQQERFPSKHAPPVPQQSAERRE